MALADQQHRKTYSAVIRESIAVKERVLAQNLDVVERIGNALVRALRAGHKILLCGNGGSAADAQHIAGELVSRFLYDRRALPAIALTTDTSIMTSIGNDYRYDYIFARQIEALGQPGDALIGITTSGNSANILRALQTAKQQQMTTVAFTGEEGGEVKKLADFCLRIPSTQTPRIQEAHITVAHALCEIIEQELCPDNG